MSSISCCLLSKAYDAWRAESCQKHFQRLLPDLTERWDCECECEMKCEDFEIEYSIAITIISSMKKKYSTSHAFNHFFRTAHRFNVENRKIKNKEEFEFDFFVTQSAVNHQIENCELYEIRFSILKATNNEAIRSCFFWVIHEDDFQIFNADWLWIEMNYKISNAKITMTMLFQISEFSMRRSRWQCFFKSTTYKYTSLEILLQSIWKYISKNFDA